MNEDQSTAVEFRSGLDAALPAQKQEWKAELHGFMRQVETNILAAFPGQ
jgi:hypothetical protein